MNYYEAVFDGNAELKARKHLLQHYDNGRMQEDLCFGLWLPGTGKSRYSAIVREIILPKDGDRDLHSDVSFMPQFFARVARLAINKKMGIAFMHSHPSDGWQGMSRPDIIAERDVLAYPAGATYLPLLGLTIGTDGYWSARFWKKQGRAMKRHWCQKVRVVSHDLYKIFCNDHLIPPPARKNILKRTYDTWGKDFQNDIARLKVGIVGLGSVGCIVAEAIARIGVSQVVLIDHDKVEEHNLDRLLYGSGKAIGKHKVEIAAKMMKQHATAQSIKISAIPRPVHSLDAYQEALDCDLLFSCVDRPIARDTLNFIAYAHYIPVIDGGIGVTNAANNSLYSAHWRVHIVTPHHQCMRCNEQYTTSDVSVELDGSLDNPSYIDNLPPDQRSANQNVFPFSLGAAGMEVNMMVRYLVSPKWWLKARQQEYQIETGKIKVKIRNYKCRSHCEFRGRAGQGDRCRPHYLFEFPDLKKRNNKPFQLSERLS